MQQHPEPSTRGRHTNQLTEPSLRERRKVMEHWRTVESGTAGERITRLDKPDDPIAYKLVDAAGEAIAQGRVQAGVNILQLVVKDYPLSQEAALCRQALDQIRKQASHGR